MKNRKWITQKFRSFDIVSIEYLVSLEYNIYNKEDLPLVAYMDFEITALAENFLSSEQNKMFFCFIYINICFSSKTKFKLRHCTKMFWSFIIKISDGWLHSERPAKRLFLKDHAKTLPSCLLKWFNRKFKIQNMVGKDHEEKLHMKLSVQ